MSCTPAALPAERSTRPALEPGQGARLVEEFRKKNRPTFVDGVPGPSSLAKDEVAAYCERFMATLGELRPAGLRITQTGPCQASVEGDVAELGDLSALGGHAVFDVSAFVQRPYAAASYDPETRTLFLPLAFAATGRLDDDATMHERVHIEVHRRLLAGDEALSPFAFIFGGPMFRPDALHADEVFVYTSDLCRMARAGTWEPARKRLEPLAMHLQFTTEVARAQSGDRPDAAVVVERVDGVAPSAASSRAALAQLAALTEAMTRDSAVLRAAVEGGDAAATIAWGEAHLPAACRAGA